MSEPGTTNRNLASSSQSNAASASTAISPTAASGNAAHAAGMTGAPTNRPEQSRATSAHVSPSPGQERLGSKRESDGVYEKAASAVSDVARSASEIGAEALDVGSRYFREGGRAVSNLSASPLMPLLMAGAVGYFMGWLTGQSSRATYYTTSRYQRSLAYERDHDDRYRDDRHYGVAESRNRSDRF